MVNNQTEFNKEYSKEIEKIEFKREDFEEQLVIEDYPNLKSLDLRDIDSIDRVVLKNLPQLQECTIWDCGTKELVIANCSQIKKLNVCKNQLTSLEYLKDLDKLEELKINSNTELIEILAPFYNEDGLDWRTYQKVIQGSSENIQKLLKNIQSLKEEINKLKENQPITIDNPVDFEKKYQKLKQTLSSIVKEEKVKTGEIEILEKKTKEISPVEKEKQNNIVTSDLVEELKEQKSDLSKLQKLNKELKKKLDSFEKLYQTKEEKIENKEKELKELKNLIITKTNEIEEDLEEFLEKQAELVKNNYSENWKKQLEYSRKRLLKQIAIKEVDLLCQKQVEISQLRLELQKKLNQINQGFHITEEELMKLLVKKELKPEKKGDRN